MGEDGKPRKAAANEADAWASLNESDDWHGLSENERQRRLPAGGATAGYNLRAPPAMHLLVVAGAQVGQRLDVDRPLMHLGRSKTNELVLPDNSISRQHARLDIRADGLFVTDLQSGNGTFIDDERVAEGLVRPGQQVGFGHVRLLLVAPGAAATFPRPQTGPAAAGAGAAAGAATGPATSSASGLAPGAAVAPAEATFAPGRWAAWRDRLRAGGLAGRSPRRKAAEAVVAIVLLGWGSFFWRHHQKRGEAFVAVQEGAAAFAEHRWDEAEQAFVNALGLVGDYELALRWQRALSRARRDEEMLAEAKEAIGHGELKRAHSFLLPMADSPLAERAFALANQWREAQHGRILASEAALQAQLPHEAQALLEQMEVESQPRADRLSLLRWQRRLEELAPLTAQATQWAKRPRKPISLWEQAASQTPAMRAALRAFRSRVVADAAPAARRALKAPATNDERKLLADVNQFEQLYDTGLEEHRGKRAYAAIKVFVQAKAIATRLVGPSNVPRRELDAKLADMYYVLGMQQMAGGKLPEAAEALRAALALVPNHALSLRRMQELESRAQRMLDEADFARGSHPARAKELLKKVSATLPTGSAVGQRARRMLASF